MYIEEINLNNFRNIKNEKIKATKNINIILGKNAQGKTNIIESIYLIANLKSFRGKKVSEVINNDSNITNIKIIISNNKVSNTVFLEIKNDVKNILFNNKKPKNISESISILNTILFCPDDILIVKGAPSLRRSLIDRAIFQVDHNYLDLLQNYFRCLKQRNAALKADSNDFFQWDLQFIDLATKITFKRIYYIDKINKIIRDIFEDIYDYGEILNIKYSSHSEDPLEYKKIFSERLAACSKKERLYGLTLIGPHRDDLHFFLNEKSLALYGSQGQQRSFILAFKTAQIIDFKKTCGVSPILLLDDMTSELDEERKDAFFEYLLEQAGQVFITSTDFNLINNKKFKEANFLKVENGKIDQ